jgi:hypothetical protein
MKNASPVHRKLRERVHSLCVDSVGIRKFLPYRTVVWKTMCAPQVVVWMQFIAMQYFEGLWLEQAQFSFDIVRFTTAHAAQLQAWDLHKLVSVLLWRTCQHLCRTCSTPCLTEKLL